MSKIKSKFDIYTNNPLNLSIRPKIDGEPVPQSSSVQVVLLDTIAADTQSNQLTEVINLDYNSDQEAWVGTFSLAEINKLLSNPEQSGSILSYEKVVLEVRVGDSTAHKILSVGKGFIRDTA